MDTNTNTNTRTLHPLLTAAAVSVIVFSGVGIAAVTGLIPSSKGSVNEQAPVAAATQPATTAPVTPSGSQAMPAPIPQATPATSAPKKHVARKPLAPKPVESVAYADTYAPPPAPVAQAPQTYEAPKPAVKPGLLGTVQSVEQVDVKGDAKGIGAVGGGVAGAVLGHNIGNNNKLVTVLGAAGGALLGNQIEKQVRTSKQWEMTVRYDDGTTQVFKSEQAPFWHQGDRVRLYEGQLQPV